MEEKHTFVQVAEEVVSFLTMMMKKRNHSARKVCCNWGAHWSTGLARARHVSGRWPDQRTAHRPGPRTSHSHLNSIQFQRGHLICVRPVTSRQSPRSTPPPLRLRCAAPGLLRHGRGGNAAPGGPRRRLAASRLRGFRAQEASPHLQVRTRTDAHPGRPPPRSLARSIPASVAAGPTRAWTPQVLDLLPALCQLPPRERAGCSISARLT